MSADTRIVVGAQCLWYGAITEVGHTSGVPRLPCCPRCGGVLYEYPDKAAWLRGISTFEESGHAGYRDFIDWLRERHFVTITKALAVYRKETGKTVEGL